MRHAPRRAACVRRATGGLASYIAHPTTVLAAVDGHGQRDHSRALPLGVVRGNAEGRAELPLRGSRFWSEYAPYDKGVRRNIIEFVRGTRDGAAAAMDLDGESEGSQTLHTEGMPPLDAAPDPHVYGV